MGVSKYNADVIKYGDISLNLGSLTVDNITIDAATITSDTGAISFSNENLTTTGTLNCGALTSTGIDDNATSEKLQLGDTRLDVGVPIFIAEQAAAATNVAGYGQIWVKSDTPASFHFMDDAGDYASLKFDQFLGRYFYLEDTAEYATADVYCFNDANAYGGGYFGLYRSGGTAASPSNLTAGRTIGEFAFSVYTGGAWAYSAAYVQAVTTVNTGNGEPTMTLGTGTSGLMKLYADGTLRQGGQIFIKETASAATDVTGYGQLWIATNGDLMYTSDSGVDRVVQTA